MSRKSQAIGRQYALKRSKTKKDKEHDKVLIKLIEKMKEAGLFDQQQFASINKIVHGLQGKDMENIIREAELETIKGKPDYNKQMSGAVITIPEPNTNEQLYKKYINKLFEGKTKRLNDYNYLIFVDDPEDPDKIKRIAVTEEEFLNRRKDGDIRLFIYLKSPPPDNKNEKFTKILNAKNVIKERKVLQ